MCEVCFCSSVAVVACHFIRPQRRQIKKEILAKAVRGIIIENRDTCTNCFEGKIRGWQPQFMSKLLVRTRVHVPFHNNDEISYCSCNNRTRKDEPLFAPNLAFMIIIFFRRRRQNFVIFLKKPTHTRTARTCTKCPPCVCLHQVAPADKV